MSVIKMTWKGKELQNAMQAALGKANYGNAVHLAGESAMQAPIESGDLRGSLEPGGANGRFREDAGGLNMTVGSNLPYAAKQHEDLSLNHCGPQVPGGKAKYLEDPLNANKEMYMQNLANAGREVLGKK